MTWSLGFESTHPRESPSTKTILQQTPSFTTQEPRTAARGGMKSNAVIPQTQTAISGSVGVPFSDGLEPALEIWSLDDVARKRRDRHLSGRLGRNPIDQLFSWEWWKKETWV